MAIILTQSFNGLASLYFFAFILFQMHKQPDFPFYFFSILLKRKNKQTNIKALSLVVAQTTLLYSLLFIYLETKDCELSIHI